MHITGIIAEYNPLHFGHQYHIEQTKAITGADYIVTVLSGDFVQRGLPAVIDKHTRARLALEAGSDLVLELPVPYALSSGEGFGFGGVSLLHQLGCVDSLSFGTEAGSVDKLMSLAQILTTETDSYKTAYQAALKQGLTHPAARLQALRHCYPELDLSILDGHSNNMLALEYCKALYRLNSSIQAVTVKRQGQHYLDTFDPDSAASPDAPFASATAIRDILHRSSAFYVKNTATEKTGECYLLPDLLPAYCVNTLQKAQSEHTLLFPDDFSSLLHYRLFTLSKDELGSFLDVTPDLANKISNRLSEYESFSQFANILWSKDITYARVCRCLMHILLQIKATHDVHKPVPYARVLGFRRDSAPLLSAIKQCSNIPLITKVADAEKILSEEAFMLLNTDLTAAHIYDSVLQHKSGIKAIHEARKQLVIL